jgi:hypothetical protein
MSASGKEVRTEGDTCMFSMHMIWLVEVKSVGVERIEQPGVKPKTGEALDTIV